MGLRIPYKRSFLILACTVTLLSCSKESENSTCFSIRAESMSGDTKSLLTQDGIENRITSTVLAAYSKGKLYRTAYYSGDGKSLPLTLENGQDYSVYALVNTGDTRSCFPEYESGIGALTWQLSSYDTGPDCINARGIPMAGRASFTGGENAGDIVVKRLLAKVTATLRCDWPGASVTFGQICNMNSVLKPFGTSAMATGADSFSFNPERHDCTPGSSSASLVFYVPENMQGTVAGISSSEDKSHEHSAAVSAMRERLTYLEVTVSGSGLYDGEITYRSYLGNNATDNFDIERNCSYSWEITYSEDNLCREDWKMDNSLDDKRFLSVPEAMYLFPGEDISLGDWITTNMPLETIGWQMEDDYLGADMVGTVHNSADASGLSFTVDDSQSALDYGNRTLSIMPKKNPRTGLGGNTIIYTVEEMIHWKNVLSGPIYNMISKSSGTGDKYFVTPGKSTGTMVDYSVYYGDDLEREYVTKHLLGKGGERWGFTEVPAQGISGSLTGDAGDGYDVVMYDVESTVLPGDYPIRLQTNGGNTSDAFVHVNDTRVLRWVNRSTAVPTSGIIAYRYLSENKIVLILGSNSTYSLSSGSTFTQNNSPFQLYAFDRSAKVGSISGSYTGSPFEGGPLHAGNYSGKISFNYTGTLATKTVYNTTIGSKTASGMLTLVPKVTSNLSGRSVITAKARNGYNSNTTHAIEAIILAGNGTYYEMVLTPAVSRVTVGATVTLTAKQYMFRINNNTLAYESSSVVSPSNLTWNGAVKGVFIATHPGNYRVSATYGGNTAYADIEVTVSDVDVSGEWDNDGNLILD